MTNYTETPPDTPRNRGNYEAPHMSPVLPDEDARTVLLNRVSWSAVFSGVFLSLAVQLVLNLLGIGIGAATLNPVQGTSPSAESLSIGAMAWWLVSGIIAAFIGGFTAGRTSGEPSESTAGWHGLTSWAAALVILVGIITVGAGSVVGGTLNLAAIAPNSAGAAAKSAAGAAGTTGPSATAPANSTAATNTINGAASAITNVTTNPNVQDAAAKTISRGSLLATIALILGAVAAWAGGRAGAVKPTVSSYRLRQEQLH
jgi:hypothetical protein